MAKIRLNAKSAIVLALLAVPAAAAYFLSAEQITLVVEDKSGRTGRSGTFINVGPSNRNHAGGKFLVYAPDEVFEVSTSYVFMKFKTAERYHALKAGNAYRVVVAGWRVPFLGSTATSLRFCQAKPVRDRDDWKAAA